MTGQWDPAPDLGSLDDQIWVGSLQIAGQLIGREQASRIGPTLTLGAVQPVVADDDHPTVRGHRCGGVGVDRPALFGRQVQVDDGHEVEGTDRRRPREQIVLQPFHGDAGLIRLYPAVGKTHGRPVDGGNAPALLRKPDRVGATTRAKFESRAGLETGYAGHEGQIGALTLEVARTVPRVPLQAGIIGWSLAPVWGRFVGSHAQSRSSGRRLRAQALVPPRTDTVPSKP